MRLGPFAATFLFAIAGASAADLPAIRQPLEETARAAALKTSLKTWKLSLAPLVASQALDASSSYGMRELNPLLASPNGGFEAKALNIKLAMTAAVVGVEYLIVRKHPGAARRLAALNWATGAVTTGFAIHNYAIK
jgi:hypothetical protein